MLVDDMSSSWSWVEVSKCYELVRIVDDMNDLGSWTKGYIYATNILGLWLTWTTPGHELRALDAKNSLGFSMTCDTLDRELKDLVVINYFGM